VATETCNGVNDDCDNATDEGFNVGASCDGVGECGIGSRECNNSGGTRCSTDPGGSASQVAAEDCNGRDDDCNGVIDNGSIASLCPSSVSNTSSTVCNGTSGCAIQNCNPNYWDADGLYGTGCECLDTEAGSDATCTASAYDLDLGLGAVNTLSGVIYSGADSDWYRVRVAAGATGGIEITFGSNPDNALRFEVDEGGCTMNPSCGTGTNLSRLTRNNCIQNTGGVYANCNNTGAREYYIRVHRASGSSRLCTGYTLSVRATATNQ
jgi:hypothetical protein